MTSEDAIRAHYDRRESLDPLNEWRPDYFDNFRLDHTGYFETDDLIRGHRKFYRLRDKGKLTI